MPYVMRVYQADQIAECFWNINHSVGVGGYNDEVDVMLVQWLLDKTLRWAHGHGKQTKMSGCGVTGAWTRDSTLAMNEFIRFAKKNGLKVPPAVAQRHFIDPARNLLEDDHISAMAALSGMGMGCAAGFPGRAGSFGQTLTKVLPQLPPVLRGAIHKHVDVNMN
jgi:hypothetical protein